MRLAIRNSSITYSRFIATYETAEPTLGKYIDL